MTDSPESITGVSSITGGRNGVLAGPDDAPSTPVAGAEPEPSWWPVVVVLLWLTAAVVVGSHAAANDAPGFLWGLIVLLSGPLGVLLYLAIVVYG